MRGSWEFTAGPFDDSGFGSWYEAGTGLNIECIIQGGKTLHFVSFFYFINDLDSHYWMSVFFFRADNYHFRYK